MGADERPPVDTLIDRLARRPQGYNLFQALSLLERAAPHAHPLGAGDGSNEPVRISSVISLGFQASDVSSVALGDGGGVPVLATPVLSLAGPQGPLPLPFTELVLERRAARDRATSDFLDIFNHRLLSFLYRGRKKHNQGLNWEIDRPSPLAAGIDSLSALGLAAGARDPRGRPAWLRHAGLMNAAPRSLSGLLAMLNDRMGIRVRGRQFTGAWHRLDARENTRLGLSASHLGHSAMLGRRAWHQSAGIQLEIDDLPLARLETYLPGQAGYELLAWLVHRYVQQEYQVELALKPARNEARRAVLGAGSRLRLGWTSWIAGGSTPAAPARMRLSAEAAIS